MNDELLHILDFLHSIYSNSIQYRIEYDQDNIFDAETEKAHYMIVRPIHTNVAYQHVQSFPKKRMGNRYKD